MLNAAPIGGNVTSGNANISQSGNTTNINQSTNKASINWQNFSIGANETVNFNQPSSNSVTLNKVVGTSNSLIQGAMNANGQVILVNPNGVVFTEGSQVNVGGIVATTKNITDQDFQNGNYKFEGNSNASILNKGTIKTKNGGYVALVADQVKNEGRIEATLGRIELASGNKFTINLNNDSLVKLTIDEGTLNSLVENKGIIKADGGKIYLTTQAVDSILDGVVNNTGIIEAQSLSSNENGEVVLFAHGGTAEIGGEIKAEGGFVETSGKEFKIQQGATVKAKNWLIDPVNITIDSTLAGTISAALAGGDVTITTAGSNTPSTTSGESGTAGDITVNSAISWVSDKDLTLHADRNININADITATGASAKLTLEYGQAGGPSSDTADYNLARNVKINLHSGQNFSTKKQTATPVDYMVINSATDLQNINSTLSGNFALGSDVDLSSISNWTPIGSSATKFTGSFDGLGHTLDHLTINTTTPNTGFFGYIDLSAKVQNIGITNGSVQSTFGNVGGLVGANEGTIKNSNYSGSVQTGMSEVGGLVGSNDGTILKSFAIANVISTSINGSAANAGGLVGANNNYASIIDSYAIATVTGSSSNNGVGGLVGFAGYNSTISTSYSSGSVTGGEYIGGLVGNMYEAFVIDAYTTSTVLSNGNTANSIAGGLIGFNDGASNIVNAYATGSVSGNNNVLLGGFIGSTTGSQTVSGGYWDTTTTGLADAVSTVSAIVTGVTGLTNANAYTQANYNGFDFNSNGFWFSVDGYTRPFLRMEASNVITNAHELQLMSMNLGNSYKLANDINLAPSLTNKSEMWKDNRVSVDFVNYKGSFVPVGDNSTKFTGTFDGQSHIVDNLYIYRPTTSYVGLFGATQGAIIGAIGLANINISGQDTTGGLVGGALDYTEISNAYTTGVISGRSTVGGLVGNNNTSTIDYSYSTVDVTATGNAAGGLVGMNKSYFDGYVNESYAIGDVTSTALQVGGLVGYNWGNIYDSYATGDVTGSDQVGGLAGRNYGTNLSSGEIYNSYSTGIISSAGSSTGGLVGLLYATSTGYSAVENSFWDTQTSGKLTSDGGTGKTTAELKNIGTLLGTTPSWDIVADSSLSNVYPQLRWVTNGLSSGSSVWVIGKGNVNYSVSGGTTNYGIGFTLPTPSFTGGTPTGATTVKVYDSSNNDVTAQAIAGTLPVGTYTVKTLLTDSNYDIANSGNTTGTLVILAANSGNTPSEPTVSQTQTERKIDDIITNIVNNAVRNNVPVTTITQPKADTQNGFERKVSSTLVNNTPTLGTTKSLGNSGLGLNEVIRSVNSNANTISKDTKLTVVGETGGEAKITTVELQDLVAKSGGGELRVALSPDSFIELVNGGVTLPAGVSQEFYVVEDKK